MMHVSPARPPRAARPFAPRAAARVLLLASALLACKKEPPPAEPAALAVPATPAPVVVPPEVRELFAPLPAAYESARNPLTEEKIALGRMLYYEERLSKNHDVSCNTCHLLDQFGVDGRKVSAGHRGQKGDRNAPTVYNAGDYVAQFWDGRAADLEEQAKGPILNPVEMAMPNEKAVLAVLQSIPGYVSAFKAAFPGEKQPITYDNLARAIGAFERKLVTPGRFDAFLGGDEAALTDLEKRGLLKFARLGCTTCHNGAAVGGGSFQKAGLVEPWPAVEDEGRFKVSKDEADRFKFKVPSLRNIEHTGPYLHDGSIDELEEVVRKMGFHQLGKHLSEEDVSELVAFLKSLTGKLPEDYIREPELPPSGPKTPRPNPA